MSTEQPPVAHGSNASGSAVPPPPPGAPAPQATESGAPAEWGWAPQQPAEIHWVETKPLEYHQLLRGVARYRWWKPLLALVLGILYYVTLSTVYSLAVGIPYLLSQGTDFTEDDIYALAMPDTQNPISLVITLGSVALMIPAVWLAMLSTGLTPVGRAWSVALKIRWRLLFSTVVPAVVALIVMNGVGILVNVLLSAATGSPSTAPPATAIDPTLALWSAIIILLLVPVQAAAEEVVFRGFFMQILGSWLHNAFAAFFRGPWPVVIVTSLLFGFAHIYDVWGWISVVLLALAVGWLTWRTGGLEAAITLHVMNNWVAFGLMVFAVGGRTGQTASGEGLGSVIGLVFGLGLYVWWVDRIFRKDGGPRTRIDFVQSRSPGVSA